MFIAEYNFLNRKKMFEINKKVSIEMFLEFISDFPFIYFFIKLIFLFIILNNQIIIFKVWG